jgi:phage recombination protein Bet
MKTSDESLLRRTVTAQLSEDEHALFVLACDHGDLDPFARQIYHARERGQFIIQATIDGLRLSAERTGQYTGQLGPEWCGPDGIWKEIWTETTPPTAARVGIRRADFADPIWGKALYSEFYQDTEFWRGMPTNQLAKCAEALGFRKAFPAKFSGLYTPEEMDKAQAATVAKYATVQGGGADGARNGALEFGAKPTIQTANRLHPPDLSGTSSGPTLISSESANRTPRRNARDIPEPGEHPSAKVVPPALQPFIQAGGAIPYKQQVAGFDFIKSQLQDKLGHEEGARIFNSIRFRLPRTFRTKEECQAATLRAWLEMWSFVEQGREAA